MPPAKTTPSFSRYTDSSGQLSNKQLAFGKWYLEHKKKLRYLAIGGLAVLAVSLIGYSLVAWGDYLIFGISQDNQNNRNQVALFQDFEEKQSLYAPSKLSFGQPVIFKGAGNKYDFVTQVSNPNERHVAFVTYKYVFPNGETEIEEAVVLPQAERSLAVLGFDATEYPAQASLEVEQVRWSRVNPHRVLDVAGFIKERTAFSVTDFLFQRAQPLDGLETARLTFALQNQSAYSYWQATFYLELFSGTQLSAVIPLTVDQFRSGETKTIDLRPVFDLPEITNLRLVPLLDVFDVSEYIPAGQ